jgi:hypothetical protein
MSFPDNENEFKYINLVRIDSVDRLNTLISSGKSYSQKLLFIEMHPAQVLIVKPVVVNLYLGRGII